jgi:undecaprenyl-diphosphatase
MTYLQTLILSIVEGITEFLPISSTGHMILASGLLGIPDSDFLSSFMIFIQLGAILAVVFYYRQTLFTSLETWKKIIAAFIPTAILGFILYKLVKEMLLGNIALVAWSLIVGGIVLIIFESWQKKREEKALYHSVAEVPYGMAVGIGIAQVLAVIPGVSRSGTTIVAGQAWKLSRKAVVDFSFLLAIPTMLAATALDLLKTAPSFSFDEMGTLALGFVISFVVALAVIKWLLRYIQHHSFSVFGAYRIIVGILFLWLFL